MSPRNHSLIRAVTDDDIEAVRALLAAGSDVNQPTSGGQTPLILAVVFRRTKILSLLLESGADPQLRDDLGLNSVDWAERKGFAEGVKLLTQHKPGTKPKLPGSPSPNQIKKQNIPVSSGPTHVASSDEKSRQWIAGLKRRIDEETSHKVKEVQSGTETEAASEREPARVLVDDNPQSASPTVSRPEALGPSLTIGTTPTPSSRKRCPKCNAIYNSELLAYCAIDMTPLVDADTPLVTSPPDRARMPLIWFLVVLTFVIAAAITYFLFHNSRGQQGNGPATLKTAANVMDLPLVAGGLSGKQLAVPVPEYPLSARSEHVSGTVKVRVTVDKEGNVIAVKVIEGDRRLRDAAIAAAQKATFSPEKLAGREAVGTITYTFKE